MIRSRSDLYEAGTKTSSVGATERNGQEVIERIEYPPEALMGESQTTRKRACVVGGRCKMKV